MRNDRGAIALSTILGITFIVGTLSVSLALLSVFEGLAGFGAARANEAYFVAQGGANDGLLRLARDRNHSASYDLVVGDGAASVSFSRVGVPAQHVRVISVGNVQDRRRRIEVLVFVDDRVGTTRVVSWREVTI